MKTYHSIDFGKFLAMLGIVYIHAQAFASVQLAAGFDGEQLDIILKVLARFSVPFFFIASGFLFTMKTNSNDRAFGYFLSYTKKLLLLYVTWFIVYAVYDYAKIAWESGGMVNQQTEDYVGGLLTKEFFVYGVSNTQYHLWFLPALIWATIILYCFMRMQAVSLLLVISFALHLFGLTGQGYSLLYDIPFNTRDPFFFGLFYVALGSFLALKHEKAEILASRVSGVIYMSAIPFLLFLQLMERNWTMEHLGGIHEEYFLSTIPLSLLIFAALMKFRTIGEATHYNRIGRNTIGIFVIHPLIISVTHLCLAAAGLEWWKEHLLYGLLFFPFVYFSSYFIYRLIQLGKQRLYRFVKIPLIGRERNLRSWFR
ncbi:acyltransferase family protein [Virgibacillus senegalensis]|uniref:acyltransferase family protein n=1 Tax=Virgibacillus senegalensis TaxID=1499679 RepID=UPI00069F2DB4|nr:acyltransferase [Virgibacillus senegalensis]